MIANHLFKNTNDLSIITDDHPTTDKGPVKEGGATGHNYTRFYDFYFRSIRPKPINLLELGVSDGASLKVWSEYFTHKDALICGVDHEKRYEDWPDPKVHIVIADQKDSEKILKGFGKLTYYWDIIIDDASHQFSDQIASFKGLWPQLTSGGLYIIEDIYNYYCGGGGEFRDFLMGLVKSSVLDFECDIEFVHFYNEAVVIGKK